MLRTVSTVIVDEIHALVRDKRGSHLALSLERLEHLAGRPSSASASRRRRSRWTRSAASSSAKGARARSSTPAPSATLDLGIEIPPSPLSTVCSHEQWEEIYARIGELVREHRTTLVFVNTRKMAERIAAQLTRLLGEDAVTSHHGSLSKARRLDAEQRLKAGTLRALVATASLELGIDVGDVDLAIQVGATRSIATFLQRVGRAGHVLRKVPKGRLFPLTLDELVEGAALLASIRRAVLDRTPMPPRPARHPRAADRRGGARRGLGRGGALRPRAEGLAVPGPDARGVRPRRRAPHGRPARAPPPRRRGRAASWERSARGSRLSCPAARSRTRPITRSGSSPRARSSAP